MLPKLTHLKLTVIIVMMFITGVATLHNDAMTETATNAAGDRAVSFADLYEIQRARLAGESVRVNDPAQTRVFVPIVTVAAYQVLKSPRATVGLVYAASVLAALVGMWSLVVALTGRADPAALGAVSLFAAVMVASRWEWQNVGDPFAVASFTFSAALALRALHTRYRSPYTFVGALALGVLLGSIRIDIVGGIGLLAFGLGLVHRHRTLLLGSAIVTGSGTFTFVAISMYYGMRNLLTSRLSSDSGSVVLADQLDIARLGILGIMVVLPFAVVWLHRRGLPTDERVLTAAALAYVIPVLLYGKLTEFRLLLPTTAVLIAVGTAALSRHGESAARQHPDGAADDGQFETIQREGAELRLDAEVNVDRNGGD